MAELSGGRRTAQAAVPRGAADGSDARAADEELRACAEDHGGERGGGFVLQGPSGQDHDGQPMLQLEKPLSSAEAGKLVAVVAEAREAVLSAKISDGTDVRDIQVYKVTSAAGAHPDEAR